MPYSEVKVWIAKYMQVVRFNFADPVTIIDEYMHCQW